MSHLVTTSSSGLNPAKDEYCDNGGLGYGYAGSYPVVADHERTGHADIGIFQPDGKGGAFIAFQDAAPGYGVLHDFATTADAPPSVLAHRIRGH